MLPQYTATSLEGALKSVGGHNVYQKRLLAVLMFVWLSYALFMEGMVFLLISYEKNLKDNAIGDEETDVAVIETIFFVGIGFGASVNSFITDHFGRKKAMIVCQFMQLIAELILLIFNPGPIIYSFCSLSIGVAFGWGEIAAFVTLSEFVDSQNRNYYLGSMNITWGLAALIMAALYELHKDWQILMIYMVGITIAAGIPLFFMDESPRYWASLKGDYRKAKQVFDRVADVNHLPRFEGTLEGESNPYSQEAITNMQMQADNEGSVRNVSLLHQPQEQSHGCGSLLKYNSIKWLFIIMVFIWFAIALSYFVLHFNVAHYLSSPSLVGMIMGVCECLSCVAAIFMMEKGRKKSLVLFTVIATIACFGSSVSLWWEAGEIQLGFLGFLRFGLSAGFCTLFTMTSELFPTVIRSVAFGACSTVSRVSSMLAPFMVEIGLMLKLDPLVVVLFLLCLIVTISFKIPETLNRDLPDYIEEEKGDMEEVKPYNLSSRERETSEGRPRSNSESNQNSSHSLSFRESTGNENEENNHPNRSLQTES